MGTGRCNNSGETEGDLGVGKTKGNLTASIFNSSIDSTVVPPVILLLTVCLPLACSGETEGDLGVRENERELVAGILKSSVDSVVFPLVILLLTVCLPLICTSSSIFDCPC